jgi:uncharacterized protein YcsI (UPF0317 family)
MPDPPERLRQQIRAGRHTTVTTGWRPATASQSGDLAGRLGRRVRGVLCGQSQALPVDRAQRAGDPRLPDLGRDIDVRTDLPRYRVFRDGVAVSEETDISALWRDDLVAFALGCSYSFEAALLGAGVPIRHIEQGKKVCTYRTGLDTVPGRASARPHGGVDAQLHRAPRDPRDRDHRALPAGAWRAHPLRRPGRDRHRRHRQARIRRRADIRPGEVPLFWACGVTPQTVIEAAKPPFCITHKAGHMLITIA